MTFENEVAGLLLAGGKSSRFGEEKAFALLRARPLIAHVADRFLALRAIAVSTPASSAAAEFARARGYVVLEDDPDAPGGPLAGICAGLAWAERRGCAWLAVAPCDTPLLPVDIVMRLAAALDGAPAAFAVTPDGDHPLCALWSVALLAPLHESLAHGQHPAIRRFLPDHGAARVMFDDAAAFANVNTPDDLARLAAD